GPGREAVYMGVKDARGRPPNTSRWAGQQQGPIAPEIQAALQGRATSVIHPGRNGGEPRIYAAAPLMSRGTIVGVVQVSVPRTWPARALQQGWRALREALG